LDTLDASPHLSICQLAQMNQARDDLRRGLKVDCGDKVFQSFLRTSSRANSQVIQPESHLGAAPTWRGFSGDRM